MVYGRDSQIKLELERLNTLAQCCQPYQEEAETCRGKLDDESLQAKQRGVQLAIERERERERERETACP